MSPGEDEMVADTQLTWRSMGGINQSQSVAAAHDTKRHAPNSAPITTEERLSRSVEQVDEDTGTRQLGSNTK